MVKIIKILILLVMFTFLLSSCEKQPDTKKKEALPVIVSRPILAPGTGNHEKPVSAQSIADKSEPDKSEPDKSEPDKSEPGKSGTGKDTKEVSIQKSQTKVKAKIKIGEEKAQAKSEQVTEELAKREQAVEKKTGYDPLGRVDPFLSLIQEKEEPIDAIPDIEEKPKRMLTPLEKIELSQIRLVAVVLMKNRQIAMVEEATGKGYEIKIGTYIGKNGGQVSKINQNSIIITEHVKDYKGKRKERFQEIKIHKKESGE